MNTNNHESWRIHAEVWRGTRITLTAVLLVGMHLAIRLEWLDIFPATTPHLLALLGVYLTQPVLVAIFAVWAPIPAKIRLPVAGCFWTAPLVWDALQDPGYLRAEEVARYLVAFIAATAPFRYLRQVRGWRIQVASAHEISPAPGGRYSLRALMISITLACLLLALGRAMYIWRQSSVESSQVVFEIILIALPLAIASILAVPCLGAALATHGRTRFAFWVLVCLAGATTLAVVVGGTRATPVALAAFASLLAQLLLVRGCGFRLVQVLTSPQPAPKLAGLTDG